MQVLETAVSEDLLLAILTVLQQQAFSQWVILSDMRQVYLSKS